MKFNVPANPASSLILPMPSYRHMAFGDKAKADEMLNESLAINADGIDPNFFRGEYLRERYGGALKSLEIALKAPARPGRELADSGRRQAILALIPKVRKEREN